MNELMHAQEKIRLLYFHPTIVFGGAERTTAALLEKLDKSIFDVLVYHQERYISSPACREGQVYR